MNSRIISLTKLSNFSYASLSVNCMTIPVYVLGAISLVIQVYLSDKTKKRAAFIIGSCIPVAVGYLICVGTPNPHAGYAGMFILVLGKFDNFDFYLIRSFSLC